MLGALDDVSLHQAVGKMNVAVGAESVGRVELALLVAIESVGFLAVVEADDVGAAKIGGSTSFDPAVRVRAALRRNRRLRSPGAWARGSWRLT